MKRMIAVLATLAAMVAMAAIGGWLGLIFLVRGREVTVPDVVGRTQSDAQAIAERSELTLEVAGTREDARYLEGSVIEQEPRAGSKTRPQRSLRVVISKAQDLAAVPAFVGAPLRKVQLALAQVGLRLGRITTVPSAQAGPDEVLAQRPAAGSRRQRGEPVDVLVSSGPPVRVYVMPVLAGMPIDRARDLLASGGVRAGVTERDAPAGAASGVVLEQRPPEGFPVKERDTVRLVVSR